MASSYEPGQPGWSVSEISPRHSFLIKNSDVFIWEAGLAGQVTVISVFAIEISKTGLKMFPYEYSSPGNRNEPFQTRELRFRNIATKVTIFVLCVHCRISSFKSPESYDSREWYKFMFHLPFWFAPVTGSFEEALGRVFSHRRAIKGSLAVAREDLLQAF